MKKIKLKINFHKEIVGRPITYELIKKFDLMFNILHADINYGSEGTLITEIQGEEENISEALQYMTKMGIDHKLYEKSIIRKDDECIECGACTAVCPSRALKMTSDGRLEFDKEKCLVCELCIKACPLRIISVEF
jgi:L-aspartate semialdehyde sulfurtransferase ferredoxin